MNRRFLIRMTTLVSMLGLAVTGLLLLFLLLGRSTVAATPGEVGPISDVRAQNGTFTVSGTVTCGVTGLGMLDVKISVWDRVKSTVVTSDTTDSGGYYSVTMEAGNYDLNFYPPCGSECASQSLKGITGPPDRTGNAILQPGHTVSGTVTGSTAPEGKVSIYAFNRDTADGFGLPLTDDEWRYCINLVEGHYDLGFTPPPCLGLGPKTVVITVTHDVITDVILPPGFTVAGCITDGIGNPVSGVQVYAYDPPPGIGGFGFAPSNESGCYAGTLPLGTFDFQFIPPPELGLGSVTITDVVSKTSGCPNTSLPITLPAGFTVAGTITCGVGPVKNVFVYAYPLEPPVSEDDDLGGWGIYTVDDGSYGLPLVSGTYSLTFTPPPATGLNAKAFTTIDLTTDTVLNFDLCVCSGAWVSETVDSAGDVGRYTSLALAPTHPYTPHISYADTITYHEDYDLKYAWRSGTTWLNKTVDRQAGEETSLALAPTYPYTPCISYDGCQNQIKFAWPEGTTWISKTLPALYSRDSSLALEPTYPYTPHVSYYNHRGDVRTLYHGYLSGATWMSGTWVEKSVEPIMSAAGWWSSLALDSNNNPHISYYADSTDKNDDLKYAWKNGSTWLSETVDSAGDVGLYTSLALDSSGDPHISYFDDMNDDVKYAWLSGTTWFSETVDSTGEPPFGRRATSLELDQADAPHIGYYDADHGDLKFAHFNGTVWIIQTVDSGGDVGQYNSLALGQAGCPCISYYDSTNQDLKYACLLPVPKVYLPIIMRNYRAN